MRRQGVTLLEVLYSVFVLSIGVLGIFGMLALGHRLERQIDRSDSVAACGKACLARVTLTDPGYNEFARPSEPSDKTVPPPGWPSPDVGRFYYAGQPYPHTPKHEPPKPPEPTWGYTTICTDPANDVWLQTSLPTLIDPIGYAKSAGTDFPPARAGEPRQLLTDTGSPLTVAIPRVTPRTWIGGVRQPMPLALADRLFSWSDDVVLPVPDDGSRPRQLHQTDASGNPLIAQSEGVYSWSVLIQPADESLDKPARWQTRFRVWVLIYQRRDVGATAPPVERTVVCNVTGDGFSGGDVKLTSSVSGAYLDIHKDSWLLLVGVDALRRVRCEFYQVRMIDREVIQEATTRWAVNATLRGPDWPSEWYDKRQNGSAFDLDGDGTAHDVLAVVVEGLVGVWQGDGKNITVEPY